MSKRGIVIANTGSPSAPTPEAVRAYLSEFLMDPRIRPMNELAWKAILNTCILPRRSKRSSEKYRAIWTDVGSPLSLYMGSLAEKLQSSLATDGEDAIVRHAMSYGSPSIRGAFAELQQAGCDDLTVISMYPQSAYSTMKVVEDHITKALSDLGWNPVLHFIESYSDNDDYRDAIAQSIAAAGLVPAEDFLLMTFHSIPMKDINAGDTYPFQVLESAKAIAERLGVGEEDGCIGFQCRFDKSRKWLGPSTSEVLQNMERPKGRLFVVAPNFSIDCLETLYDIEVTMRRIYTDLNPSLRGIEIVYVPCLNDSDAHVRVMRSLI